MRQIAKTGIISTFLLLLLFSSPFAQDKMYKIVQYDTLGNIQNVTYRESILDQPENVLVVYNINYQADENDNNIWDGYEIASYYQEKRNIPSSNIVAIKAPTNAEITRGQYDSSFDPENVFPGVRQQLENILNFNYDMWGNPLRSKIKYIVLTKGIPYKIKALNSSEKYFADYSSVDASVAMLFNGDYNTRWYAMNPYFNQDPDFQGHSPFIPEFYTNFYNQRLSFLVTRLDGYSVGDIKGMIDRAVRADTTSRNFTFIIDDAQKLYDYMFEAYTRLKDMGAKVYPDPWEDTPEHILSAEDSVIGIVTHGIHAGLPSDYLLNQYAFDLADGAIFSSYESLNGSSFSPNIQVNQGQIADFIKSGGSGGIGNVYEPYSSNIAHEEILLPAYFSGYTFAEASYMSLKNMDWTSVVVGDPLMRIGPKIVPVLVDDFRVLQTSPRQNDVNQSTTTVAEMVFSYPLDSTRVPCFISNPAGDTLRTYIHKNYLYAWSAEPLPHSSQIRYETEGTIFSQSGDSISSDISITFSTHTPDRRPYAPTIYRALPGGIDVRQDSDIILFFSQQMQPETIYPLLGNKDIAQTHTWTDGRILHVSHSPFFPATVYSFYVDEHAKSVDNLALEQNFYFSFETTSNFVAYDIDNDGREEYASNSNHSLLDGYEVYVDTLGYATFLLYTCDLNADNQPEFLISKEAENIPSYYWDPGAIPYTGYLAKCFPVDDDEDGVNEYAFDETGSGYYTKVYDPNDVERIRDIKFALCKHFPWHLSQNVSISTTLQLEFTLPVKYDQVRAFISADPAMAFNSIKTELNGRKIILHPTDPLLEFTEYHITVKAGILSIKNDPLLHDYEYVFQTGSQQILEAPRVISFYPGDSLYIIDNTPTVRFNFSLPMDTLHLQPVNVDTLLGVSWSLFWADSRTLYLFSLEELEESQNYKFILSADLKSKEGVFLEGKRSFNFTSGDKGKDFNNPFILQILPLSNNSIRDYQSIDVIFSEWLVNDPEEWLNAVSGDHKADYSWSRTGKNLFRLTGNPSWQPQSKLELEIEALSASDNSGNQLIQNYTFEYNVIGEIVRRDVDEDGITEYIIDGNHNLLDGLEMYVDPGGIHTQALFSGYIDDDGFYDFLIADPTGNVVLTWYPARSDSGILGFTEQIADSVYEMSVDSDALVEFRLLLHSGTVQKAVPRIRFHSPQNAADKIPLFTALEIEFNTQMAPFSVVQNTTIIPSVSGKWAVNASNSHFTFTPALSWSTSTIYSVKLAADYQAINGQSGTDSTQFSFRIADSLNQPGEVSWQFPQTGDSVHSQSIYYFGFTEKVDTSITPSFQVIQDFKTYKPGGVWISDTVLSLTTPVKLQEGETELKGQGQIKFLSTLSMEFNSTTSFIVFDDLKLQMIKSLTNNLQELPVNHRFPFIFNQPLDSSSFDQITFHEINGSTEVPIPFSENLNLNYLSLETAGLKYSTGYVLRLNKMLKGISTKILGEDIEYYFQTEKLPDISNQDLYWRQETDFLIITWPIPLKDNQTFELYVCEDFKAGPDTITFANLCNVSQYPSWLLDLNILPARCYIFVRLNKSERTYWAKPSLVHNVRMDENELASFPVIQDTPVDNIPSYQNKILTVSQWDAAEQGWNSSKYIKENSTWLAPFIAKGNRGILVKVSARGQIGWMQSVPDTFRIRGSAYQTPRFRSICNPFYHVTASQISGRFGHATRLAIWDKDMQGWNEAVYDTVSSAWINDFTVDFMSPVYVCTDEGFDVRVITGNFETLNTRSKQKPVAVAEDHLFPSITRLIYLPGKADRMMIFKENEIHENIAGCGIDQNRDVAYINIGNLDGLDHWKFQYYDKNDRLIYVYDLLTENEAINNVPKTFSVDAPYPNPFNNSVNVPINIPDAGKLNVIIYNILGQCIHTEESNFIQPQKYLYHWDSNVATGIYFIQIKFLKYLVNKKLVLIK